MINLRTLFFFLPLFLVFCFTKAQPGTDIWVGDLKVSSTGKIEISGLENLSNNPGYDNQPYFLPDGKGFLFTSDRGGEDTDIYQFEFRDRSVKRITETPASEFSPQLLDANTFSTVRIDTDQRQRLWLMDLEGKEKESLFGVENIGYSCWSDRDQLIMFLVEEEEGAGHQLIWGNKQTAKVKFIDKGIGRGLGYSQGNFFYTVDKGESGFEIIQLKPGSKEGKFEKSSYCTLPEGVQDFALTSDSRIICAQNGNLKSFDPKNNGWNDHGVIPAPEGKQITRIAIDKENVKIALVISE